MANLATLPELQARLTTLITADQEERAYALLADVSAAVRAYTGQEIEESTDSNKRLRVRNGVVRLPQRPVTAVASITDEDGNTVGYTWDGLDRLRVDSRPIDGFERNYSLTFPYRVDTVLVTYTHGFSTIPADIVAVVCQIAARAIGSPATESGITQEALGAYSYSRGGAAGAGPFGLLADERAVLDRYRTPIGNIQVAY